MFVENTFTIMPRHALHARSLGFIHPRTGKMTFESDLPADFQKRWIAGAAMWRGERQRLGSWINQ